MKKNRIKREILTYFGSKFFRFLTHGLFALCVFGIADERKSLSCHIQNQTKDKRHLQLEVMNNGYERRDFQNNFYSSVCDSNSQLNYSDFRR